VEKKIKQTTGIDYIVCTCWKQTSTLLVSLDSFY